MALYIKTGEYTGDGTDNRSITGIGFQPKFVMVIRTVGTGEVAIDSAPSDTSYTMQGSSSGNSNRIQAFQTDGFQVGSEAQVNSNGSTYKYLCIGGDSSDIVTGSYTGDGTSNRSITGVGFQPVFVLVKGNNNSQIVFRHAGMTGTTSQPFIDLGNYSNGIQAFETDGFQVGANDVSNAAATYYYVAIKDSAFINAGTYTGDGTDNRQIGGSDFEPDFAWTKRSTSATVFRNDTYSGDSSTFIEHTSSGGTGSNYIQGFYSDGFEVGSNTFVNANTATFFWVSFKNNASTLIKTINSIAKASVKTINGLAISSVKSVNGLQ